VSSFGVRLHLLFDDPVMRSYTIPGGEQPLAGFDQLCPKLLVLRGHKLSKVCLGKPNIELASQAHRYSAEVRFFREGVQPTGVERKNLPIVAQPRLSRFSARIFDPELAFAGIAFPNLKLTDRPYPGRHD
ncbi:MAG: hypothetical protein JO307_11560, partial [Bryobacterales bacterium]|nr:hypothetical protein [Bryobacterales bacterium]